MIILKVLTPKRVIFEDSVESIFFPGDLGEFEVLPLHKPVISLLRKGDIIVDWEKAISIKRGIMKMKDDRVVALVEE